VGTVTLRDVANAANVSTATVSRALAHPQTVGVETGERVVRLAEALGYVRNGAAGALASSRSCLIGVLMPRTLDEGHAAMLAATEAALAANGYGSLILLAPTLAGFRRIVSAGVEGIALLGTGLADELRAQAAVRQLPLADLCTGRQTQNAFGGALDLIRGTATVGAYLFGLGHRRFALIGARELAGVWHDCTAALESALGEYPGATVVQASVTSFDFDSAATRVREWLGQPTPPSAIICSDDVLAAGALRGCARAGKDVPSDVSVVGVGDFTWSRHTEPALTTLRLPWAAAARSVAARLLAEISASEEGPAPETPPPVARLVVRGTSDVAKAR
jgi:LacI family transcriptional regulator